MNKWCSFQNTRCTMPIRIAHMIHDAVNNAVFQTHDE